MPQPPAPPLAALALVSAAALAYEILLTRLLAIVQWQHFAAMTISLAMLGYGVSGTVLSLLRERLLARYSAVFTGCAAAFGLTAVLAFLLAQRLPFNALELLWDARQPAYLLLLYLLLAIPFAFAAACIGLTLARYGSNAHRVYSFDLVGAASGGLLVLLLLTALPPMAALKGIGLLGLTAALLAAWQSGMPGIWRWGTALAAAALLLLPPAWTALRMTPYKPLSQALLVPGARIVEQHSGPLGMLTVIESPQVPLRHAPGLSLNATGEPPPQLGIFTDGDGLTAITRFDGRFERLAYLDQSTSALPYRLLERPHVLVLGAGGGAPVLQALLHRARRVDAVDLDPNLIALVRDRFADFAGGLYQRPEVRVHAAEARHFVEASEERYDLIQVELMDAFGAASSGVRGSNEHYLYTIEALQAYLRHLKPEGMLSLTRWVTVPPRDILKLAATAMLALEREGVAQPETRLALIRGWQTATLLVKNTPFSERDIAAVRAFARERSFDVEWLPGLAREESNRYNMLDLPYFHDGIRALAGPGRQDFIEHYKFDLTPATDDQPYFFRFFRWQSLPEILSLRARGGLPLLELGYPVLLATLLQAMAASALLILLPLTVGLRQRAAFLGAPTGMTFGYFSLVGLAFIFIEIAFIQKFTLYLGHPLYAIAVVLFSFLLFAGLGSRYAPGLQRRLPGHGLVGTVAGIVVLTAVVLLASGWLMRYGSGLPDALRALCTVALISPLACLMGMPFPLGMERLADASPGLLPWAWGVNACATVVGAALAALTSLHLGLSGTALLALALYAGAATLYAGLGGKTATP